MELKHGGIQKETRIRGLIPRYANNDIYHIIGECDDLESELIRFPRGKHDDVIDALAYGQQICMKPYEQNDDDLLVEDKPLYNDINL